MSKLAINVSTGSRYQILISKYRKRIAKIGKGGYHVKLHVRTPKIMQLVPSMFCGTPQVGVGVPVAVPGPLLFRLSLDFNAPGLGLFVFLTSLGELMSAAFAVFKGASTGGFVVIFGATGTTSLSFRPVDAK